MAIDRSVEALVSAALGSAAVAASWSLEQRLSQVASITDDSRKVVPGSVFVAVPGTAVDGSQFMTAAQNAGAILVVGEKAPLAESSLSVPFISVTDARFALARLAAAFYGFPSRSMKVVGVTGTSGKTTSTFLIEAILRQAGWTVGVVGTVNYRFGNHVLPASHTTPGAAELQALLAQMKEAGCQAVVMEVSSHALKQRRVGAIGFDVGVFTNLSPEHLDFHTSMDDYFESKKILFTGGAADAAADGKTFQAVVHTGDSYGKKLAQELRRSQSAGVPVVEFSMEPGAQVSGHHYRIETQGIHGSVGGVEFHSPLVGRFNAQNLLGAIAAAQSLGIEDGVIAQALSSFQSVPGRLEGVPNSQGIQVLVDYAHKPDALEKVLHVLREVRGAGRLICVFGCGGDRDRSKRPVMGRIAAQLSDWVWVTSDNPRREDPHAILAEIVGGMAGFQNFQVEMDRERAIQGAVAMAKAGDLVLIAGKGHEDYQIIADASEPSGVRKIPFDDRAVAARALSSKAHA